MIQTKYLVFSAMILATGFDVQFSAVAQDAKLQQNIAQRLDKLGDPLPDKAIMRFGTKRLVHRGGGPSMIALSVDEKAIFSMSDEWMMAWSTETGKLIWQKRLKRDGRVRIGAAGYGVRPMSVVPDTGELVWSSANGSLNFSNPQTGETRTVNSPTRTRWKAIDVSPDSKLFAIGGSGGSWICDANGKLKFEIPNNPQKPMEQFGGNDRLKFGGDFSYARFSPDGKILALVNSEKPKTIQTFEGSTGVALKEINCKANIVRIDFSPDGTKIAASERDSAARLYDLKTADRVWEFVIPTPLNAESYTSDIAFRPDGKQIAVGAPIGSDNRIRLLDAATGLEQGSLSGSGWKPWPMQYTSDGKFLYGSGWSADIHKWNTESQTEEPLPQGAVRASATCAMSGDGKHLAYVDTNGIQLFDIERNRISKTFRLEDVEEYGQIIFNEAGSNLAAGYSGSNEISVVIWNVDTGKELHRWNWAKGRDPHSSVEALSFSQNGNRIAAAVFRQSAAYVFDLPNDKRIANVKHRSVYGMDINKDGSTLYTTGWDRTIRAWKTSTGEQLHSLTVDEPLANGRKADTRAYGLKLSNDQKTVATCDMTQKVRFFDRKLQPIGKIDDAGWFTFGALAFSHNDLWFGVGTGSGAKVFDVASGDVVFHADEHDEYIYTVDFGVDDQTLISGGSDSVCYLWDIVPPESKSSVIDSSTFQQLTGSDGTKAYAAYMSMRRNPDRAAEILEEQLATLVVQTVDKTDVTKLVIGLGSDSDTHRKNAKSELLQYGPCVYDGLTEQLDRKLTDAKRQAIRQIQRQIHQRYRRATVLLTEIESGEAPELIDELIQTCKTKKWKLMLFDAMKRRKKLSAQP